MKVREIISESKQKVDASKPRNFVAKNAKMGGAGQHKDKKKAMKQGDAKHKNKEIAEGAVKEFAEDLKSMSAEEFYAKYKMSKADARAGLQRKSKSVAEARVDEKAVSKAQQKFMGMVYAAKKGEKPASPEVAKVAKGMSKKSAKDYAATKHKGKPDHVKETATAGSTSAGNVAVGAVYKNKKPKMQKPGTNALDMKGGNLMTGGSIKR